MLSRDCQIMSEKEKFGAEVGNPPRRLHVLAGVTTMIGSWMMIWAFGIDIEADRRHPDPDRPFQA